MTSTIPKQAEDFERRVAELEADLARERRAARDQTLLYRIAALGVAADDMETFYKGVHDILRELLYAENCYVALYDEERQAINYAYYVDTDDDDPPDPRAWVPFGAKNAKGVTAYILRTGNTQHQGSVDIQALIKAGELVYEGPLAADYIGVPLRTGDRTVGVLAVQSYVKGTTYDEADVALMRRNA
jgi:GAF domain-containing protein